MSEYKFTRKATYIEFGVVTANDKKEAIQKIKDNDYDDIIDTYLDEEDNNTIELEGEDKDNGIMD